MYILAHVHTCWDAHRDAYSLITKKIFQPFLHRYLKSLCIHSIDTVYMFILAQLHRISTLTA